MDLTRALVDDVRRIAVLRANAIGDFLLAVPALEAVRAAYPQAEITVLGAPWHVAFLPDRPGPWDRVVCVPPSPGIREPSGTEERLGTGTAVEEFLAEERARGYDLALQLHGGGSSSNPFVTALGARVSAGSRARGAPPLDRTIPYTLFQHETLRFLELVALVGAAPVTLLPRIAVTERDHIELQAADLDDDGPLVVVHPGATDARRRWPTQHFAAVADALAARGAQVVVVGSREDVPAAAQVVDAMSAPATSVAGRLGLGGLAALLERAVLLVGNDSGPRHLAAAVGTATVAVYWAANVMTAGPMLRERHRLAVSFDISCPVCGEDQTRQRCPHDPSFVASVPVDEVLEDAIELFEQHRG